MVMQYASFMGTTNGMDTTVITEIADYYRNELNYDIPPMTPFVGEAFNMTRAGVHADGLIKDPEIYNVFDTESILNRPPMVAITNTSGLAGIAYWANNHYGLTGDAALPKHDPILVEAKAEIDRMYEDGRTTVMSDGELEEILFSLDPARFPMGDE